MSLAIFSFIFVMWILIIIGGGLMVLFVGPLSFSGDGDLDPLINSGLKVFIAMILIFIWVFTLLKIKNWIFIVENQIMFILEKKCFQLLDSLGNFLKQ